MSPRLALVGAGQWGLRYARVLASHPRLELTWICDPEPAALAQAARIAPRATMTASIAELLKARDVDAVVIATPANTHAEIALAAIETGRHVLVEKPVTLNVSDAEQLVAAAGRAGIVAMVGHLMVHHPAVEALANLVRAGELGEIYYLSSIRSNLGRARSDENALWSFGPHDLSMIELMISRAPSNVTARGECYLRPGIADVVFLNLGFPRSTPPLMANVQLSWLSPRKERRLVVVGSKKMAEFDDCAEHPLRIFDRGYDELTPRNGDTTIVPVERTEPLVAEIEDFVDSIARRRAPKTPLSSGLRIARWITAAQASMETGGTPMHIE